MGTLLGARRFQLIENSQVARMLHARGQKSMIGLTLHYKYLPEANFSGHVMMAAAAVSEWAMP